MADNIIKVIKIKIKGKDVTIDINKLKIIEDLMAIMYYEYNDKHEINLRKKIIVENGTINGEIGETVELKISKKVKIGKFKIIGEENNKKIIKPTEDNELFSKIEDHDVSNYSSFIWKKCEGRDNLGKIEKYKPNSIEDYTSKGLFEIYYKCIENSLLYDINEAKATAMYSYLAIRDVLNYKLKEKGYVVSNPNVFINGINTEFDALIVKKGNENKFIYNIEDVYSVIEIKSSGYFASKKILNDKKKTNNFINYVEANRKNLYNIPYIYLSVYESFGVKKDSIHYYEYLLANLSTLEKNVIGIFCGTKKKSGKLLVPYNNNLDDIIDKLLKKIKKRKLDK